MGLATRSCQTRRGRSERFAGGRAWQESRGQSAAPSGKVAGVVASRRSGNAGQLMRSLFSVHDHLLAYHTIMTLFIAYLSVLGIGPPAIAQGAELPPRWGYFSASPACRGSLPRPCVSATASAWRRCRPVPPARSAARPGRKAEPLKVACPTKGYSARGRGQKAKLAGIRLPSSNYVTKEVEI